MSNGGANRPACAACRQQRRKCNEQCIFAPYFPPTSAREFEAVHKVFGVSNITKVLTNLDEQGRREAINSFQWEAMMWQKDPVHGPFGAFKQVWNHLQQQQQMIQTLESKLMGLAQAQYSPPFSNGTSNLNWAPQIANNVGQAPMLSYQEKNIIPYPYVHASNALHPTPDLLQSCSIMQPSHLPSQTRVDRPDTELSSGMDQPSQGRDFQFCDDKRSVDKWGCREGR
ncbi:LOB domain-containing protein 2-like [Lotus japonicus]|uniref:LOB domain-containing protein 2-like n=1 Tax=Lotus japonicus TaxID=34305 RepID=UPI0025868EC1|nr:LOB domain-containing protein 2-like [Lotus japonicus]